MRTPLSSCRTNPNLAVAPCGDGDRCTEGSVVTCGTLGLVLSRLAWDPERGRRGSDEEELNTGDENCGRSRLEGGIPPLLDVLAGSENLLEIE